jgi:hypothetical protein
VDHQTRAPGSERTREPRRPRRPRREESQVTQRHSTHRCDRSEHPAEPARPCRSRWVLPLPFLLHVPLHLRLGLGVLDGDVLALVVLQDGSDVGGAVDPNGCGASARGRRIRHSAQLGCTGFFFNWREEWRVGFAPASRHTHTRGTGSCRPDPCRQTALPTA